MKAVDKLIRIEEIFEEDLGDYRKCVTKGASSYAFAETFLIKVLSDRLCHKKDCSLLEVKAVDGLELKLKRTKMFPLGTHYAVAIKSAGGKKVYDPFIRGCGVEQGLYKEHFKNPSNLMIVEKAVDKMSR
jgi:hypothetical protein